MDLFGSELEDLDQRVLLVKLSSLSQVVHHGILHLESELGHFRDLGLCQVKLSRDLVSNVKVSFLVIEHIDVAHLVENRLFLGSVKPCLQFWVNG